MHWKVYSKPFPCMTEPSYRRALCDLSLYPPPPPNRAWIIYYAYFVIHAYIKLVTIIMDSQHLTHCHAGYVTILLLLFFAGSREKTCIYIDRELLPALTLRHTDCKILLQD